MPTMPAVAAMTPMHEKMHHQAGRQKDPGQPGHQMDAMLYGEHQQYD